MEFVEAAAAVAATMYGSPDMIGTPHLTQVRTNIPAILVHTRVGTNSSGTGESTTVRPSATTSTSSTNQGETEGDSQNRSRPQNSTLPNVAEFTASEYADLLRSVREAEASYHQLLVAFEETLRKANDSSSGSSNNNQIQRGISKVMLVILYYIIVFIFHCFAKITVY